MSVKTPQTIVRDGKIILTGSRFFDGICRSDNSALRGFTISSSSSSVSDSLGPALFATTLAGKPKQRVHNNHIIITTFSSKQCLNIAHSCITFFSLSKEG